MLLNTRKNYNAKQTLFRTITKYESFIFNAFFRLWRNSYKIRRFSYNLFNGLSQHLYHYLE